MSICAKILDDLPLYIDNALDTKEISLIDDHIKSCPSCEKELNELTALLDKLNDLEELELPPNYHQELIARLNQEMAPPKTPSKGNSYRKYTFAAACVVVFATVWFLNINNDVIDPDLGYTWSSPAPAGAPAPVAAGAAPQALFDMEEDAMFLPEAADDRLRIAPSIEPFDAAHDGEIFEEEFLVDEPFVHRGQTRELDIYTRPDLTFGSLGDETFDNIVVALTADPLNAGYEPQMFTVGAVFELKFANYIVHNVSDIGGIEELLPEESHRLYVVNYGGQSFARVIVLALTEELIIERLEPSERGSFEASQSLHPSFFDPEDSYVVVADSTMFLVNKNFENSIELIKDDPLGAEVMSSLQLAELVMRNLPF